MQCIDEPIELAGIAEEIIDVIRTIGYTDPRGYTMAKCSFQTHNKIFAQYDRLVASDPREGESIM
jgi:hypothetical protein